MKKTIMAGLLIAFLLLPFQALAMEKGDIHYGVKAGPNFSFSYAEGGRTSIRYVAGGGAFMSYNLGASFQIQPEVLFMMRGWKEVAGPVTLTNKLNYVDVDLLLQFLMPSRGRIQSTIGIGPYVGMKISDSYDFNIDIPPEVEDAMDAIYDEIKSTDFGIVLASEMDVMMENGGMFLLELRIAYGLTSIMGDVTIEDTTFNLIDLKNMGIQIFLGYAF